MPNLGHHRALLLFFEKPLTTGKNNQSLHMIKLHEVPECLKEVVEVRRGQWEQGWH
jgi:hypothetical protein